MANNRSGPAILNDRRHEPRRRPKAPAAPAAGACGCSPAHAQHASARPRRGPRRAFADTWMSRLLIGGALLLLAVMFPLQWLRTPTLVVRANVGTFAPRPGVDPNAAEPAQTGTVTANYDLSEEASINAQVYDSAGALVKTLVNSEAAERRCRTSSSGMAHRQRRGRPDGAYRLDITAKGPARSTSGSRYCHRGYHAARRETGQPDRRPEAQERRSGGAGHHRGGGDGAVRR